MRGDNFRYLKLFLFMSSLYGETTHIWVIWDQVYKIKYQHFKYTISMCSWIAVNYWFDKAYTLHREVALPAPTRHTIHNGQFGWYLPVLAGKAFWYEKKGGLGITEGTLQIMGAGQHALTAVRMHSGHRRVSPATTLRYHRENVHISMIP